MQNQNTAVAPRGIQSRPEGEQLLTELAAVLEGLLTVIEEETALVRDGKLTQAADLGEKKAGLAGQYYNLTERLKANSAFLKASLPARMSELKLRHDIFRELLQINLAVLATVHAVSEGIVRGVAGEMAKKAAPQTYGMSGRPTNAPTTASNPVAVLRTL